MTKSGIIYPNLVNGKSLHSFTFATFFIYKIKIFRQVWQNIILGQFLSLTLCAINTLSHCINTGTSYVLPTSQSFPHYMFLCAIFTSWLAFRRGDKGLITIIKIRGWRYLLLCLIDVQANTLMSAAHQFTTLTSIQVRGLFAWGLQEIRAGDLNSKPTEAKVHVDFLWDIV